MSRQAKRHATNGNSKNAILPKRPTTAGRASSDTSIGTINAKFLPFSRRNPHGRNIRRSRAIG